MRKRLFRIAGGLLALVVAVLLGLGLWIRGQLVGSLPQLDGQVFVPNLSTPVTVERDAIGVPTIQAASRLDLAMAMGFIHAQDRFFQMDLLRRNSAG